MTLLTFQSTELLDPVF